jgi:hypothetical protein
MDKDDGVFIDVETVFQVSKRWRLRGIRSTSE